MRVPGQAGRWFAVLVAVPMLTILAVVLLREPGSNVAVARVLLAFASVFLVYEVFWLLGVLDYK